MLKNYKYILLLVLVCSAYAGCLKTPPVLYDHSIAFTGNTKGLIEHCGCKIKRGRILERSHLLKKIAAGSKETFFFDGGNSITSIQLGRVKLLKVMEYMGYSAYFVTAYEYKDLQLFFNDEIKGSSIEFSSAVIADNEGRPLLKPFIERSFGREKAMFVSVTGHTNVPGYYNDIKLVSPGEAIEGIKIRAGEFDWIFLITDFPEMDLWIKEAGIKNVRYIYHLDKDFTVEEPYVSVSGAQVFTLNSSGQFFWQIGMKYENSEMVPRYILNDVKMGVPIDKDLKKYLEELK